MAVHPRAALLGARDRQCAEQAAEEPKSKAKRAFQEIWMAETKKEALVAFNALSDPGDWVTRLLRRVVSGHFDDPMPFG
jgi:hypothetical protein